MMIKNLNWYLKWLATLFTVAGAIFVTLNIDFYDVVSLKVGSVLWIIWALRIREWSIVTVNAVMIAIYGYGIIARLL